MTTPIAKHVYARATRDRIIDLLGLGETYPLRDVTVGEEQLTVDFDAPSAFDIEPAQEDVDYALWDQGLPVKPAGSVTRVGLVVTLQGPVITEDKIFQVHAAKIGPPQLATLLLDTAKIKVGLNTGLRAWISRSLLNPLNSGDLDPRVTDYRTTVDVRVAGAQALVRYQLTYPGPDGATVSTPLTDEVPVNGTDLTLTTGTVTEDTQIDVHMTRTFQNPAQHDLEGYLERDPHASSPPPWNYLKLPLAVRANPALVVSIQGAAMDGSPLVDPVGSVTITLASSQTSVEYSVYARPLLDADFELAPAPPGAPALLPPITVPASTDAVQHDVLVHEPPRPDPWTAQDRYVLYGQPTAGNAGNLALSIGHFEVDTVFVIKARKTHQGGESALQLQHALVALPRPKLVPALSLALSPSGQLSVSGGQRGVFYHFRRIGQTTEIGLPAYFHRLDEANPQQNRGVGQLRIETDFAVARDPDDPHALQTDPASRPVPDPIVELTNVPPQGETSVSVTAIHARTGVAWLTSQTIPITRP
jgi:hypothetical protein